MRPRRDKPRPRRWLWLSASVAATLGFVTWGLPRIDRWQLEREGRRAFGSLVGCLEGPEARDEDPAVAADVMRRRSLATTSSSVPASGEWPARCSGAALALELALGSLEQGASTSCPGGECCPQNERCQRLAETRGLTAAIRTELGRNRVESGTIAALRRAAAACGLDAPPLYDTPPPVPVTILRRSKVRPVARGIRELTTDPATGDALAIVLHGGRGAAQLCDLDLGEGTAPRCWGIGHLLADTDTLELLGRDEGAPPMLLVSSGVSSNEADAVRVVHPRSGTVLARLPGVPLGGHVWTDGSFAVVVTDPQSGEVVAWHGSPGTAPKAVPLALPSRRTMGPVVVGEQLLWVASDRDGAAVLWALALRPIEGPGSSAVRVDAVGALDPRGGFESCRSGGVTAVVLRAAPEGHRSPVALAWSSSNGWSRIRRHVVPSPSFGLACFGESVSLGWTDTLSEVPSRINAPPSVSGRYLVGRLHCTPEACIEQRAELALERFSASSQWIFADAGSHASVFWRGPLGDVRHRTAPLEKLEGASDQPLFDDAAHDGFAWELGASSTVVRAGTTVLLARTTADQGDGASLLAIDRDGVARALQPALP